MKRELDPRGVAARLGELRLLHVPELVEEARVRLQRERPRRVESLEQAVSRRLNELRALAELARYLHRPLP
ncbi:MAG: hypothetical protein JWP01_2604 [Myxococcales bacterium]|nr:hypothetical protein [Myxococcales bacterium]